MEDTTNSDAYSSIISKKEKVQRKKGPDLPADRAERFFDQVHCDNIRTFHELNILINLICRQNNFLQLATTLRWRMKELFATCTRPYRSFRTIFDITCFLRKYFVLIWILLL